MKKILLGILSVAVVSIIAFGAIFDNAARQTAKHDLQSYYENHEVLADLAYYTNWRHAVNSYLGWLPEGEEGYPFLWFKNKHKQAYESLSSKEKDNGIQIYADYLFYIKPCLDCIYPEGDIHLKKGLQIIADLSGYDDQNSLLAKNELEVAADTFELIFQLNAERIIITRPEYHQMIIGLWRFLKNNSVSKEAVLPYLERKKAFFFLGLFQHVTAQVKELGVANLGCTHPLIIAYMGMEKEFDGMAQLARDKMLKYSRGKVRLNIKSEARNSINTDIRMTCLGADIS